MENVDRNSAMLAAKRGGKSYRQIAEEFGLALGRTHRIISREEERQEMRAVAQKGRVYPVALEEHGRMLYDALQAIAGSHADRLQLLREWGYQLRTKDSAQLARNLAKIAMAGPAARRDNDLDIDII